MSASNRQLLGGALDAYDERIKCNALTIGVTGWTRGCYGLGSDKDYYAEVTDDFQFGKFITSNKFDWLKDSYNKQG